MDNNTIPSYSDILKALSESFSDCPDIIMRKVYLKNGVEGYFIFIEELVNFDLVQRDFISHILSMPSEDLCNEIKARSLPVSNIKFYYDIPSIVDNVLSGEFIFIFDGMKFAISCILRRFEGRAIEEPIVEKNVKGSHEGFVETLNTNIAILRRKIKNNNLKFKRLRVGTSTNQIVVIAYMQGIANPEILNDLYNKIKNINIDGIIGIGYIEQLISSSPNSPFPQFLSTERPDKVMAMLLEGRLAVMLDGTPVTTIAPVSIFSFLQAPDDYNSSWIFGSFVGLLRELAMLIALFLPGIYIAITSFHYYMVPLRLLIPLAESRERVPFPPYIEALIMELTIELIREASIRLPSYIGSTIGIIGGIIVGQAAVQAGLVSVLMIIVVAITAIASYTTPISDMGFAIRFFRFIVMIASATYGLTGILICWILLLTHLLSLESLGQPYFSPIVPFKAKDLKDVFIRLPLKYMKKRPDLPRPIDKERGKNDQ
ncbi:spore germination protein [Clostridium sp. OS1-26]|uniref:spore germination protein n=1 Tax=Clostridium sp. OS1-26 TaxID=3070681 RepID=UPI0027E05DDC|nr:spore germination protein [Clostridium sp. OS1-26]WML35235.1 spore germination protein [Clostridium sp. OS1-26]